MGALRIICSLANLALRLAVLCEPFNLTLLDGIVVGIAYVALYLAVRVQEEQGQQGVRGWVRSKNIQEVVTDAIILV